MITVHQEASAHLHGDLHRIRELGCHAGVALNPATPAETLSEVLGYVDLVLVMTVNPGFGGQKFNRRGGAEDLDRPADGRGPRHRAAGHSGRRRDRSDLGPRVRRRRGVVVRGGLLRVPVGAGDRREHGGAALVARRPRLRMP